MAGPVVSYAIDPRPAPVRALERSDHQDRDRIRRAIALLGQDPRLPGAKALQGRPVSESRSVMGFMYTVDYSVLVVAVITLGHRRILAARNSTAESGQNLVTVR